MVADEYEKHKSPLIVFHPDVCVNVQNVLQAFLEGANFYA